MLQVLSTRAPFTAPAAKMAESLPPKIALWRPQLEGRVGGERGRGGGAGWYAPPPTNMGLLYYPAIMEIRMEKNMENDMETGGI